MVLIDAHFDYFHSFYYLFVLHKLNNYHANNLGGDLKIDFILIDGPNSFK